MTCHNCDKETKAEWKFCRYCGASQALKCWDCNADIVEGAKFCPECKMPRGVNAETDVRNDGNRVITGTVGVTDITIMLKDGKIVLIDRG